MPIHRKKRKYEMGRQASLTKLGEKYGVKRQTLSKHLKDRGYEVINYQNRVRCDETVFEAREDALRVLKEAETKKRNLTTDTSEEEE